MQNERKAINKCKPKRNKLPSRLYCEHLINTQQCN